ncbi:Uncharacterized protein dnm_004030 [Desulfonema magnum]|uniref:Uncharacterized protein n=1 Tax=Desulfonema magnum TaxID=45655 RepID=A0A975BFE3_9BACT|nr:Uncharacterized protein dnm_004030 [Desulfonema magnum]
MIKAMFFIPDAGRINHEFYEKDESENPNIMPPEEVST